mmetsp:Transcript_8380/g.7746  ORF Transcript_8380/g.7746 Transcript_8380/m.7746 type:complete len:239 (-) Transcript_8380:905-1621(-)
MEEVSEFYGLFFDLLPFRVEEPVIQVDACLPNQVISKQVVIVVGFQDQGRSPRELSIELIHLIELRVRLIQEVVVSLIVLFLPTLQLQVRIRKGPYIPLSKVKALQHIQSYQALGLAQELPCDQSFISLILQEVQNRNWVHIQLLQHDSELNLLFLGFQLFQLEIHLRSQLLFMEFIEHVEDELHSLVSGFVELCILFIVEDRNLPFEATNALQSRNLARLISLRLLEETKESSPSSP